MGYDTDFEGELLFKKELKASELAYLQKFLGADRRDIGYEDDSKVYEGKDEYWYHIDLELTEDMNGLKWNGAEKSYGLHQIVNFITKVMREKYPKFELTGKLNAQGEEIGDRWSLVMKDGVAKQVDLKVVGDKITCPHCEKEFVLEDK